MSPQPHHQYIIYVGDSFSASMDYHDWKRDKNRFQYYLPVENEIPRKCHPSLVSNHYKLILRNFSYGGKSWWYSRYKLYQQLKIDPHLLERTYAIVFTHTNNGRLNTENDDILPSMWTLPDRDDPYFMELKRTELLYNKHLCSPEYHEWSQEQWFRELSRKFSDIPTVHFHCFPWSVEMNDLLPGRKFTTPLIHIQIGEMSGTDKEIEYLIARDALRANHLNDHNNQALADTVINALENYQPGTSELDLSKFNVPNKNAYRWPNPGFGSK